MCGIFGFIGKSTNPKVSFDLANSLFVKTEIRGEHASGFWSCETGDGCIAYDKEPVKSTVYVNRGIWAKDFASLDADLLVGHCRLTSIGPEKINKNNHPHWSEDKKVAMVHNGKIPEYNALKDHYATTSECDSEILLRMFESAEAFKDQEEFLKKEFPTLPPFLAYRLLGLKEIFSRVNFGAMAVGIAERGDDGSRYLWLFRDDDRPLHVVDMRKTLGQIFFCSTAEIWRSSVGACSSATDEIIPKDQVIIEFPSYQVWLLAVDAKQEWNIRKFKITKTKYYNWEKEEEEDKLLAAKKKEEKPSVCIDKPVVKTISRLGKDDAIIDKGNSSGKRPLPEVDLTDKKKVDVTTTVTEERNWVNPEIPETDDDLPPTEELSGFSKFVIPEGVDMEAFDRAASEIEESFQKLKTQVHNLSNEGSLSNKDFSCIMDSMESLRRELEGTLHIVGNE
jgi:Glutamine amidotransferase domain